MANRSRTYCGQDGRSRPPTALFDAGWDRIWGPKTEDRGGSDRNTAPGEAPDTAQGPPVDHTETYRLVTLLVDVSEQIGRALSEAPRQYPHDLVRRQSETWGALVYQIEKGSVGDQN